MDLITSTNFICLESLPLTGVQGLGTGITALYLNHLSRTEQPLDLIPVHRNTIKVKLTENIVKKRCFRQLLSLRSSSVVTA